MKIMDIAYIKKNHMAKKQPTTTAKRTTKTRTLPFNDDIDILKIFETEISKAQETLDNIDKIYKKDLKWFDRFSDSIAQIGGSWTFIITFLIILFSWIILNSYILINKPFDPFPFILLNLVLSCVAALQAPVILMAQNRAAKRDQARAELDLEKDLRDLHIDQQSHKILLDLHKDMNKVKKKLKLK